MTAAPHSRADHYSYSRLRGSRDGGGVRRAALQRPDRPPDRRDAGAGHRRVSRRRWPAARVLDVGTGTGRAAIALAARGARVTGVDASAEMLAVAERRAKDAGVDGHVHAPATPTGSRFADRSFDAVICLRVLMHTPDWRQSLGELCRVARDRVVFDYPALVSAAALQAAARRAVHACGATGRGVSRVRRPRGCRARSPRTASGSPTRTGSSSCRSRCTSGSIPRRPPAASKGRSRAPGSRGCSDRPSRSWRSVARPSHRAPPGSPAAHLAPLRWLAARRSRRALVRRVA